MNTATVTSPSSNTELSVGSVMVLSLGVVAAELFYSSAWSAGAVVMSVKTRLTAKVNLRSFNSVFLLLFMFSPSIFIVMTNLCPGVSPYRVNNTSQTNVC